MAISGYDMPIRLRREAMEKYRRRYRDIREDRDMTQQQVAEYLGMKQPQYSRYERGVSDMPASAVCRLADLYDTSTDYLLGRTSNSKYKPR